MIATFYDQTHRQHSVERIVGFRNSTTTKKGKADAVETNDWFMALAQPGGSRHPECRSQRARGCRHPPHSVNRRAGLPATVSPCARTSVTSYGN